MLGLFFLYWIGKFFYKLAGIYNKSQWGYALLGILAYYTGILVTGFIAGLLLGVFMPEQLDNMDSTLLGVCMLPFGGLACYLYYTYLGNLWKKNQSKSNNLIQEIGKPDANNN